MTALAARHRRRGASRANGLPEPVVDRYREVVTGPVLAKLRSDMELIDTRLAQLLEQLGDRGNVGLWRDARRQLDALKGAAGKGNDAVARARVALQELDELVTTGLKEATAWDELFLLWVVTAHLRDGCKV